MRSAASTYLAASFGVLSLHDEPETISNSNPHYYVVHRECCCSKVMAYLKLVARSPACGHHCCYSGSRASHLTWAIRTSGRAASTSKTPNRVHFQLASCLYLGLLQCHDQHLSYWFHVSAGQAMWVDTDSYSNCSSCPSLNSAYSAHHSSAVTLYHASSHAYSWLQRVRLW